MPNLVEFGVGCGMLCAVHWVLRFVSWRRGGGINVPIFLLVFGYSFKRSAINSYYVVLGNAFAQSFLNIGRKHPKFHAHPMIFWEFVAMLLPAQIGGSNLGGFIVKSVPDFALYLLALLVLLFASVLSFLKGLGKWRIENDKLAFKNNQLSKCQPNGETKQDLDSEIGKNITVQNPVRMFGVLSIATPPTPAPTADNEIDEIDEPRLSIIEQINASTTALRSLSTDHHRASVVHEAEFMTLPRGTISIILLTWLCYTALLIGLQYLSKCSASYGVVFGALYIPLAGCSYWTILHTRKEPGSGSGSNNILQQCYLQTSKILFPQQDSLLDNKSLTPGGTVPKASDEKLFTSEEINDVHLADQAVQLVTGVFAIGIVCALLGIGGGELLSPLMLSLHLRPEVTSATSAMMSFLNTAALVVKTLTYDTADYRATLLFLAAGFLGGLLGRKAGLYVSTHFGRASYIIFALVAALALTCVYYIYELGIGAAAFESGVVC